MFVVNRVIGVHGLYAVESFLGNEVRFSVLFQLLFAEISLNLHQDEHSQKHGGRKQDGHDQRQFPALREG